MAGRLTVNLRNMKLVKAASHRRAWCVSCSHPTAALLSRNVSLGLLSTHLFCLISAKLRTSRALKMQGLTSLGERSSILRVCEPPYQCCPRSSTKRTSDRWPPLASTETAFAAATTGRIERSASSHEKEECHIVATVDHHLIRDCCDNCKRLRHASRPRHAACFPFQGYTCRTAANCFSSCGNSQDHQALHQFGVHLPDGDVCNSWDWSEVCEIL